MTEQEHLARIKARCEALLEGAKMRTPEKWSESPNKRAVYCACYQVAYTGESNGNAAFIASCAGPAEAGWRATIAAIDLAFYSMGFIPAHQITFKPMIDAIRAAWPVELLT